MSTQPEALRLADALGNLEATGHCSDSVSLTDRSEAIADAAAAELRRLSIENDALGLHLSERMKDLARVEDQRDALLEALKLAADFLEHSTEFRIGHPGFEGAQAKARAAIKSVEEGK